MNKLFIICVVVQFALASANAQESILQKQILKPDSIIGTHTDSLHNKSLDSLQKNFKHRTDSLQKAFEAPMNHLQSKLNHLHHKKDSLSKLNLPTQSVTDEIKGVEEKQTARLKELNSGIDQLKKETLGKASALQLPPQAQSEINALTKNVQGFSVPNSLTTSTPSASIPSLPNLNINTPQLSSLSQAEQSLGKEISQVQSTANLQSAEKAVANDLSQDTNVKSLLKEETQVKDMQGQFSQLKDSKDAEALAKQQLQPAINHFAGKEQELKTAMDQVSKLKQKYSSVKSLAELPKRRPNPLKDKPWFERIVPGLNYFLMNKGYTLVDFNPYVGWRFTPRLSASIGWNQRIGISDYSLYTKKFDRVFGMRTSVSYLWTHGITFKVSPEVMNAYVPTNSSQEKHESLVWGLYAGVRKDFPIYKSLKGYSEVLYNFTQKPLQNIYTDRVSFRFGIEMQLKKKVKKEKNQAMDSLLNRYKSEGLNRKTMLGKKLEIYRQKKIESKKYTDLLKQRFTKPEVRFIKKKKAFSGMSEEALYQSLGNPIETYVTNLNGATKKQCVYQHNLTVYVSNGKVTDIQKAKLLK